MNVPEGMTAEKLYMIADWFDTYDKVAELWLNALVENGVAPERVEPARKASQGKELQTDLRWWAAQLERSNAGVETFVSD